MAGQLLKFVEIRTITFSSCSNTSRRHEWFEIQAEILQEVL